MDIENLVIDEISIPFKIYKILGDGACLFSSLSLLVYGDVTMSNEMRNTLVSHVSSNWDRFKCYTQMISGAPCDNVGLYFTEMSKPSTYGSICEIMAAAELFPYQFQVYQSGCLIACVGEAVQGVKRLRFTGDYNRGHFDVYMDMVESIDGGLTISNDVSLFEPQLISDHDLFSVTKTTRNNVIPIQSKRGKKRRKRFTSAIRDKQIRQAVKKYSQSHPEVHRAAARKYARSHPRAKKSQVKLAAPCSSIELLPIPLNGNILKKNVLEIEEDPLKIDGEIEENPKIINNYELINDSYRIENNKLEKKQYTCNACNKSFIRKIYLYYHLSIHTGERNYICCVCNKRFAHNHSLKIHMQIHTDEKLHQCYLCERRFLLKCHLVNHLKTHAKQQNGVHYDNDKCGNVANGFVEYPQIRKFTDDFLDEEDPLKIEYDNSDDYVDNELDNLSDPLDIVNSTINAGNEEAFQMTNENKENCTYNERHSTQTDIISEIIVKEEIIEIDVYPL